MKTDSKATMLHGMAQKGVEVVLANKPMIIQEGKRCWLSANATSAHITVWTFCAMWPTQLQALLSGNRSGEGLTSPFSQILSGLKS